MQTSEELKGMTSCHEQCNSRGLQHVVAYSMLVAATQSMLYFSDHQCLSSLNESILARRHNLSSQKSSQHDAGKLI